ncbi:ankyrin [Xylariaceae sp. FL0016]|nr:ankyrin [Xylariaceae sp. FL0016]
MQLLDLPPELLHQVLVQAIIARGVKRGLRLKLVCRTFAAAVRPALFETKLLDHSFTAEIGAQSWFRISDITTQQLWHSYVVRRVREETDPKIGGFVLLRSVAEALCQETTAVDLHTVIDAVCWMAFESLFKVLRTIEQVCMDSVSKSQWSLSLLAAAVRFDIFPLTQRLLQEGHDPTRRNILPSACETAARWGTPRMLDYLQQHIGEGESVSYIAEKTKRSDLKLLESALEHEKHSASLTSTQEEAITADESSRSPDEVPLSNRVTFAIQNACWDTHRPEVLSLLQKYCPMCPGDLFALINTHAGFGNLDMVRYLLDLGDSDHLHKETGSFRTPLNAACRKCHEDVVDLLLERGADPNHEASTHQRKTNYTALTAAARVGSFAIVRKLLDHGADVDARISTPTAIEWAFRTEHTAMVELLLSRGATLDGHPGRRALKYCSEKGLDSMVDKLRSLGVVSDSIEGDGSSGK